MWTDIAMIIFSAVAVDHLGLVRAVEGVLHIELPVINCCKCLSFWTVLFYADMPLTERIAVSFLMAYIAVWLELAWGYVDILYERIYDKIYTTEDNQTAADSDEADSDGGMS